MGKLLGEDGLLVLSMQLRTLFVVCVLAGLVQQAWLAAFYGASVALLASMGLSISMCYVQRHAAQQSSAMAVLYVSAVLRFVGILLAFAGYMFWLKSSPVWLLVGFLSTHLMGIVGLKIRQGRRGTSA